MLYRCILPDWAREENPGAPKVLEDQFRPQDIEDLNSIGYNVYYLPNYSSAPPSDKPVSGENIDVFEWVFVDFDLKSGTYSSKEAFLEQVLDPSNPEPTKIVDSGNGIHVYWRVADLEPMSYLRFQRRLCRKYKTDEAVSKIFQLMRLPGTLNTKVKGSQPRCEELLSNDITYTSEQLDLALPPVTPEDEIYCQQHYDKTFHPEKGITKVDEKLPLKFAKLLRENAEVKDIWSKSADDRSKADYRLAHILFAHGFTKEEAASVLINCAKAISRSPHHRISYATNIIDKIWTFEAAGGDDDLLLSKSVKDILSQYGEGIKGQRFPCYEYLDATDHGFRLSQVVGLVAGSGVGKTAMALNMFMGFVKNNPEYVHFFIPLEQPANEVADRWRKLCGNQEQLHDKVHIISNYADDGSYRNLSFSEIKEYLLKFKKKTGKSIGCVVIDHIGALKKKGADGENQGLMDICHEMKAFAVETNTLLVMQSQAPREKAGIGDLELSKDAAYGTVYFESYCDYLITIWQPLKRCYDNQKCPKVTAFKFCKIRHKNVKIDLMQEDQRYFLKFDPDSGQLEEMTQEDEKSFQFFNSQATQLRKQDRKTDILSYKSTKEFGSAGKVANSKN